MDRRKAMKVTAGIFAGSGIGLFALANGFKPKSPTVEETSKLDYVFPDNNWRYTNLEPEVSAEMAYNLYSEGSCMYAAAKSIISQLAEKVGEPYTSFPSHMFKYGHGGIGGYGSVCGALNGAAAIIGLVIPDKSIQNKLITDIFKWYENESFPIYNPVAPEYNYTPSKSVSHSVLCHASNTNWCNKAGFDVGSKERKERCRRLSADIAGKVSSLLNELHANNYVTNTYHTEEASSCIACHGKKGKVNNASVKMSCTSCHSESVGHKIFADAHYKFMKE